MKVLLIDLDVTKQRRPFPNLALMKLSAYHKAKGDDVFLNFSLCQPDVTYASCVFTWHSKKADQLSPDVNVGGSGIKIKSQLPDKIEHIKPDYDLYPNVNFSLGYTSRGCFRPCPWCIVIEKEGWIRATASIYEFWDPRHKKLLLLDNNLLASPNCRRTFADLQSEDLEVDINQGMDIRLVNDEVAWQLARLKTQVLRFSFDDLSYESKVREGIKLLTKAGIRSRKLSFYVLVGFGDDETALERMKLLQSLNVTVFPMIYRGPDGKEPEIREKLSETILWHGGRGNLKKFLRLVGRLS